MSDWLLYIIKSEFLWGIVLGLCIALIGARVQAKQQIKKLPYEFAVLERKQ